MKRNGQKKNMNRGLSSQIIASGEKNLINEHNKHTERTLVFIDDSGDPGFKGSASSDFFVMAAVVIPDKNDANILNQMVDDACIRHGWGSHVELKFHKSSKKFRCEFLKLINKVNFDVYAIYVDKNLRSASKRTIDGKELYNKATEELIAIIPQEKLSIIMDGKFSKNYRKSLSSHLRNVLNIGYTKVDSFNVHDSSKDNLVQIADFVAGAINRSFQTDKTDNKVYLRCIKQKIIKLKMLDPEY